MSRIKQFAPFLITALFLLASCSPDKPDEPDPNIDPRDKFVGTWSCKETSQVYPNNPPYNIIITKDETNSTRILMANFYQLGASEKVFAVPAGSSLQIPQQSLCNLDLSGSGSIDSQGSTMLLDYKVSDGNTNDTCSAILTK